VAKFRDLSQSFRTKDRVAGDKQRHRELVKEFIKLNLADFLEELDIFQIDSQVHNNIHKINLKMAKEYRFVFDPRQDGARIGFGQSDNVKPGDVIGVKDNSEKDSGVKSNVGGVDLFDFMGGNMPGKLVVELTNEEIEDFLDEVAQDLNLPFLSPRKTNEVPVFSENRWRGLKESGIEPRLDFEASYLEKLKRENMLKRRSRNKNIVVKSRFVRDDLRYHGLSIRKTPQTNVLFTFIMDVSGSMDKNKRYFSKAFCYALYNFLKNKYQNAEKIFIAHDTEAREVDSDTFFKLSSNGGTKISSGINKAIEIIKQRFNQENWDIYCVHCSDGENSQDDEINVVPAFRELISLCKLVGFLEVKPQDLNSSFVPQMSQLSLSLIQNIKDEHFKVLFITLKEQISKVFSDFLSIDKGN
jgi:uncharacterized sporulation protein YeaH/YhbH (DUF444 family)